MRSEFQYFMSKDDHIAFDDFLLSINNVKISNGKHFDEIIVSDGNIQYERSQLKNGVLIAGRIAIATTDLEGNMNFSAHEEIERLYKKLRKWLKKHSVNNLVCFNESLEKPVEQAIKNFWLASGAELCHKRDCIKLKQFESGNVAFKLA